MKRHFGREAVVAGEAVNCLSSTTKLRIVGQAIRKRAAGGSQTMGNKVQSWSILRCNVYLFASILPNLSSTKETASTHVCSTKPT